MRHVLIVLVAVLMQAAGALAQAPASPAAPILALLVGRWEGSGTILGQPARLQLEWSPALAGRFVRLTHVSHIGAEPKAQRFEGHAYYQVTRDGRIRATWFDSTGLVRPIEAVAQLDRLVASWGTPETEVGETSYVLLSADRLEVVDRVRGKDGAWREFGRSTVSRAP